MKRWARLIVATMLCMAMGVASLSGSERASADEASREIPKVDSGALPDDVCLSWSTGRNQEAQATLTLTAFPLRSGTQAHIALTWTPLVEAVSYDVYRNGAVWSSHRTCLSHDDTSVVAGNTYAYYVLARNSIGGAFASSGSISCTATAAPAIGGCMLSASSLEVGTNARIYLTWTSATNAESYDVYRNNSPYATYRSGLGYNDTNVTAGVTYSYYILARNSIGSASVPSNTVNATANAAPTIGDLTLTATPLGTGSAAHICLTWSPATNATLYDVYRNSSPYATYISGLGYNDANVTAGITYSYYILARNSVGSKAVPSNSVGVDAGVPPTVGDFEVTAASLGIGTGAHIALTWTVVAGAASYDVYRNDAVYAPHRTGLSYDNTDVTAGVAYSYCIVARNASNDALATSNTVTCTPTIAPIVGGLVLSASPVMAGDDARVCLTWTPAANATLYDVYRDNLPYSTYNSGLAYNDTNVTAGVTYSYYILARNSLGSASVPSNTVNATANAAPTIGDLTLTATPLGTGSGAHICLTWSPATNATLYDVYRNHSPYVNYNSGLGYNDTNVTAGITYSYYILARNSVGSDSVPSNTVESTASDGSTPLTLTVTIAGSGSVIRSPDLPGYTRGSTVTLSAHPDPGWDFIGWSGSATGVSSPVTVIMDADKSVVGSFRFDGLNLASPWNLVSVSVPLLVSSIPGLQAVYGYHDGWSVPTTLTPGEAYWVQVEDAITVPLPGTPSTTPVSLTYQAGWQLLGNPFDVPLPMSSIANHGLITVCYSYGPAWGVVDLVSGILEPGRGYWVNLSAPTTLTLARP